MDVAPSYPGEYNIEFRMFSTTSNCEYVRFFPKALKVAGIVVDLKDSNNFTCNPANVFLNANAKYEYNPFGAKTKHFWRSHKSNANVLSPNDSITQVLIKDKGAFKFTYTYETSQGCVDSFRHLIQLGVNATFAYETNRPCLYDTVKAVHYKTPVVPDNFYWFTDSSHKVTIINPTAKTPRFVFKKPGLVPVTSIQWLTGECADTFTRTLNIIKRDIDFISDNTNLFCAPQIATFNIRNNFANRMYMDFGDGENIQVTKLEISHLYKRNSGPDGFDITLVGIDVSGCVDTVFKKGFMKVIGPIIDVDISPTYGCEYLNVKFKNNSDYYTRFITDFGDGTVLDSTDVSSHVYKVFTHPLQETYHLKFVAIDEGPGYSCPFTYIPPDSIVVLKKPDPDFRLNVKRGCAPLKVQVTNQSFFAQDFLWDFDNDGVIDATDFNPSFKYTKPGVYYPTVIARNINDCRDTFVFKDSVDVLANPIARIEMRQDSVCALEPTKFWDNSSGFAGGATYSWDFADPNKGSDTSTLQNPIYSFTFEGQNIVQLRVEDTTGCWDTALYRVWVFDTILKEKPDLHYVSVEGDDVMVNWKSINHSRFNYYEIALDESGYMPIATSTHYEDTVYRHLAQDVHNRSICYSANLYDTCGFNSGNSRAHCTIWLGFDTLDVNQLKLEWTSYSGWGFYNNYKYDIYRSDDGGAFNRIGSVNGNITEYIDDTLCDKLFCYYVEAVHLKDGWKSKSNKMCSRIQYEAPSDAMVVKKATVIGDKDIFVEWTADTSLDIFGGYSISRNGGQNFLLTFDTAMIDSAVNVHEKSYRYEVRIKDHCNNYGAKSNVGKTMLLTGKGGKFNTTSDWTPYEDWGNGVKEYIVQIRDLNGDYKELARVSPNTLSYEDADPHTELEDSFCYRIIALEDGGRQDTSTSNISCVAPNSVLFVPTGFTPNSDELNDVFIPYSAFLFEKEGDLLRSYQYKVFNRWGELIFETTNPKEGWDGSMNGVLAPMGSYLYTVKAVGLDGVQHNLNGYVSLIR